PFLEAHHDSTILVRRRQCLAGRYHASAQPLRLCPHRAYALTIQTTKKATLREFHHERSGNTTLSNSNCTLGYVCPGYDWTGRGGGSRSQASDCHSGRRRLEARRYRAERRHRVASSLYADEA